MAMYLGTQKITPAIIEKKTTLKLLPPKMIFDKNINQFTILTNPFSEYGKAQGIEFYDGDTLIERRDPNASTSVNFPGGVSGTFWHISNNIYSLPSVDYGPHNFKAKSVVNNYSQSAVYNSNTFDINSQTIEDSDFSEGITLNRYNYRIVSSALYTTPDKNQIVPKWENEYIEGNISNYTIENKFTISSEGAAYGFSVKDNVLTSANKGKSNTVAYVKVSFTLEADTDLTIKARSYGESNYDYGVISEIDTSLSTGTTEDTTNVKYNFKGKSSANWIDISYGTLSAGNHFFTAKYLKDSSGDNNDDTLMIELPESFINKVYLENTYLPKDIIVKNFENPDFSGNSTPSNEYEYDPYTGDFKVKITGYTNIRINASTTPLLDKLTITPSTWDTKTSILKWEYPLENITYHITTPDGNEYTTTEKSFDFTGKLGEPSAEYKNIKIYAQNDTSISGTVKISLIYNPNFNTVLFNGVESANDAFGLPNSARGLNLIYRKDNIIYYINNYNYKIYTLDINTGENTEVSEAYSDLSGRVVTKVINNKIYFCDSTFFLEYDITTKKATQYTTEAYSKNFEIYDHYVITSTGYKLDLNTNTSTRIINDATTYAISNIYATSKILLISQRNIYEYDIAANTSTKICTTSLTLNISNDNRNTGYRNGNFLYLFGLGTSDCSYLYKINLTDGASEQTFIPVSSNDCNSYQIIDNILYLTQLYNSPSYLKINLTNGEHNIIRIGRSTEYPENLRSMIEYNGYGYVYLRQNSIVKFLL